MQASQSVNEQVRKHNRVRIYALPNTISDKHFSLIDLHLRQKRENQRTTGSSSSNRFTEIDFGRNNINARIHMIGSTHFTSSRFQRDRFSDSRRKILGPRALKFLSEM
jgi:hypothetical protein